MVPEFTYWAVLLAIVSGMIIGSIWNTPKGLGTYWR
jgi:hypothetical protein